MGVLKEMELNIAELEKEYISLGGKVEGGIYTEPTFDNPKIRHLQSEITSVLLDYRHAMDKNVIRAQIPSYKRRMLEKRDGLVKELEQKIQADLDKKPEYVRSQALHNALVSIRNAKSAGVHIGDTLDKKALENIFTGLGGKIYSKSGKKRTKLIIYDLPKVESEEITRLNDIVASESAAYMNVEQTIIGKIPSLKKKRISQHLARIEKAERQIEKEKMGDLRYASAKLVLDVINAYNGLEKTATKEMAD